MNSTAKTLSADALAQLDRGMEQLGTNENLAEKLNSPRAEERMVVTVASCGEIQLSRSFPKDVLVTVGRDAGCHVVLPSPHVSRTHLEIRLTARGFELRDTSSAGTQVAAELLHDSLRLVLEPTLSLDVGPYQVKLRRSERREQSAETRRAAHGLLLERLRLDQRKVGSEVSEALRAEVREALEKIVAEPEMMIPARDRARMVSELSDEALGLGPLEALLADDKVSEVMVVDARTIYAERAGRLELTGRAFTDDEAVRSAIERIVTPLGRRIDESSPLVDARLPDGSRVNAVIPPLALRGPCITIRKFPKHRLTMNQLVQGGSLSARMARFVERSVAMKKNIVISGGTGSGKTTLLNVLSASIDSRERIVTIEDAAELSLSQPHVVSLESKPPNLEGRGEYTIRDLVKNALRMRPDRIVVGECRGGEALDMLQAMNTGHEGSMTTTHANSPEQAVSRIETLCLMGGLDLPLSAIRRQIADSVHLILQQSRLANGCRKITRIAEVVGLSDDGEVEMRTLFSLAYDEERRDFEHVATGYMPSFLPELRRIYGGEQGEVF